MFKKFAKLCLTCSAVVAMFSATALAGWEGPYKLGTVQSNANGQIFVQLENADGSQGKNMMSAVSADSVKAATDLLLQGYLHGKRFLLNVNGTTTEGWDTFSLVQVGDYNGFNTVTTTP